MLLSCKGDNISTITYNAKGNSYFTFNTDDNEKVYCGKVLSDFENKNADETMKIYMNSGADYFYSGFTVDYDKQDESVKVDSDGVAPVSMNVYLMANDSEKAAKILSKYNAYSLYCGEAVSNSVKAEYIEKTVRISIKILIPNMMNRISLICITSFIHSFLKEYRLM